MKKIEYKDEEVIKNLTDINGENIIFYAIWDSNSYHKIKYELNGGQNSLNNKSKFLETQDVVLYEPRKEDSEFLGWYDNPEFEGKKIIGWSSGQYTSDIILYAKWNSPEYTVTFNDRDNVFYQKVEYGRLLSDIKLPEVSGATFGGFYTQKYGKGEQYIDSYGYAIKEFNQKSDLELYAFWNFKIYYDISYVDSMYGANMNPTTYTGERDIVLKEMQCRVGYVFEGWLDEYGDIITVIPQGSYGQRIIKCKGINPIKYTITYEKNGGEWDSSINKSFSKIRNRNLNSVEYPGSCRLSFN
ncbi:MAG: InlB B-repeat-containing protein [Treponema sp.]|nr:InlB B-repeat-containing protein [Treponema sp.]